MITGMSEPERMERQVSRPPMPGMFISSRTRAGISWGNFSSAIPRRTKWPRSTPAPTITSPSPSASRNFWRAFGIAHRKDDHRNVRAGADGAASLQAAHAGHVHIQQDQGGHFLGELFERVLAGAGFDHLVAVPHQRGFHDAANLRIVVYYQDLAGAHRSPSRAAGSEK